MSTRLAHSGGSAPCSTLLRLRGVVGVYLVTRITYDDSPGFARGAAPCAGVRRTARTGEPQLELRKSATPGPPRARPERSSRGPDRGCALNQARPPPCLVWQDPGPSEARDT